MYRVDDDDLREYDLGNYDEDEAVDSDGEQMGMFNIKALAYHKPGEADPYITIKDVRPSTPYVSTVEAC